MLKFSLLALLCTFALSACTQKTKSTAPTPLVKEGDGIWDLTPIYADRRTWEKSLKGFETQIPQIAKCKGRLGRSSQQLLRCLQTLFDLSKEISRLYSWASLNQSTDLKNAQFNEDLDRIRNSYAKFSEAASFFNPELIRIGAKRLKALSRGRKFADYSQFLKDVLREAKHTLSSDQEALLSAFSPVLGGSIKTRNLLYTADIPWPQTKLSNGQKVTADDNGYRTHRSSPNRSDRIKIFASFYATLKKYERSFGSTLARQVQLHTISAQQRKYPNALSSALGNNDLPEAIYRQLVKEVNKGLPTLHRYLKLRAKILGIKDLAYHDNYPELVKNDEFYGLKKSRELLLEGVRPLGPEYVEKTRFATGQKWMHAYPAKGKRGGAYMSPRAYDVHPYVFLNHKNDFDSAMTYAHEWGHAMHSVYAMAAQPYTKARYPIFTAEIASTVSEALVLKNILSKTTDPKKRLFFLGHELEFIRGTFFRQTQFAEFELKLHEEIEAGRPLSGQKISKIYGELVRKYYGHDQGIMNVPESYFTEWAIVPHFYYNFYVYQYATSVSAGYHFATEILKGRKNAVKKYLTLLASGGAEYPHKLLLKAGLDMTQPDAYRAVIQRAEEIMDEMEAILAQIN